ncbi:MAG: c-type cytochrome [Alphaproteobacteria bacterium]|nr:c-type cytochrome [Alphaproteobacteria bacterium]
MRKFRVLFGILGLVTAVAGLFWWYSGQGEPTFANAEDAALVARGEVVYVEQCAACHGADLEGQPNWRERRPDGRLPAPPHDETGHTWHHADLQLFEVTKYGTAAVAGPGYRTDMAAFGSVLSDTEIWAVLAYIKSRWPKSVRQRHAEINKRK